MVNGRVERKNARRINGDKEEPEKPRIGVKKKSQENTRERYLYSNGALFVQRPTPTQNDSAW